MVKLKIRISLRELSSGNSFYLNAMKAQASEGARIVYNNHVHIGEKVEIEVDNTNHNAIEVRVNQKISSVNSFSFQFL